VSAKKSLLLSVKIKLIPNEIELTIGDRIKLTTDLIGVHCSFEVGGTE
jgi:hypothetical protein